MFCDELDITVQSGKGGDGSVSYRREKYIPKGGPDGGDGGTGGSVFLTLDPNLTTLYHLKHKHLFQAEDGHRGEDNNKHGKNGQHISIPVPEGTLIYDDQHRLLCDISPTTPSFLAAVGGRGGYGNSHFTSSTRQTPDFAELGDIAEKKQVHLELKLVADIGIIGFPSRGKSTLISVISAAKPKIADYDFTTLIPNLGVVSHGDESFVVCDIPGLIEGASEGKGLGHEFLKHVERTRLLIHLLDASRLDSLVEDYRIIRNELQKYSERLSLLPEMIVINKSDLIDPDLEGEIRLLFKEKKIKHPLHFISAATHQGIQSLLDSMITFLHAHPKEPLQSPAEEATHVVLTPSYDEQAWTLDADENGKYHVKGPRIEQLSRMTNTQSIGAMTRMADICHKLGIDRALQKKGLQEGDVFYIAGKQYIYEEEL